MTFSKTGPRPSKPIGNRVEAALDRAKAGVRPTAHISAVAVDRFGQLMREKLTTGEVPFRKAYLGSIVDRIEVVRIR